MIVPTMSPEEIRKQIEKDAASVQCRALWFSQLKEMEMRRRRIKKQTVKTKYKSGQHNEWNIVARMTPEETIHLLYTEAEDPRGKVAYQIAEIPELNELVLLKYNTHFFTRYREREALSLVHPSDIMHRFFKKNYDCKAGVTDMNREDSVIVNYIFQEGIGFGVLDTNLGITTMKTYLPHRMLNNKQKNTSKQISESYEQMSKLALDDNFWDRLEDLLTAEEKQEVGMRA